MSLQSREHGPSLRLQHWQKRLIERYKTVLKTQTGAMIPTQQLLCDLTRGTKAQVDL